MKNQNYINNQWRDSIGGAQIPIENPFTQEIITEVPNSSERDVDSAVSCATSAWKIWRSIGSLEMRDLLRGVAEKSRANEKDIASIICAESGKPLIECLDEIEWLSSIFEYYSEIGRDQRGRIVAPVAPNSMSMVLREH